MKRAAAGVLVSAAAVALAIGCDQETITLPEPPMAAETQQLVALYDMPTATLDVATSSRLPPTRGLAWRRFTPTGSRPSSPTC